MTTPFTTQISGGTTRMAFRFSCFAWGPFKALPIWATFRHGGARVLFFILRVIDTVSLNWVIGWKVKVGHGTMWKLALWPRQNRRTIETNTLPEGFGRFWSILTPIFVIFLDIFWKKIYEIEFDKEIYESIFFWARQHFFQDFPYYLGFYSSLRDE